MAQVREQRSDVVVEGGVLILDKNLREDVAHLLSVFRAPEANVVELPVNDWRRPGFRC